MRLDRFIVDRVNFFPCAVMVGCVMSKDSLRLCVSDDVIIHVLVEGGVLEFIGFGCT